MAGIPWAGLAVLLTAPLTPADLLTNMRERIKELSDDADLTHERVLEATTKSHAEWLRRRAQESRTRGIVDELELWAMALADALETKEGDHDTPK